MKQRGLRQNGRKQMGGAELDHHFPVASDATQVLADEDRESPDAALEDGDGPRAKRLSAQVAAIGAERPDVVALQEITATTVGPWRQRLAQLGLTYCADTADQLEAPRGYANLLAARWPLTAEPPASGTLFPEKLLSASLAGIEVHVFHAPTGVGSGWGKVDALESLHCRISRPSSVPQIVCGDFNAPQAEPPGRPLVTFAQDAATGAHLDHEPRWFSRWHGEHASAKPWDADRWDSAERNVLAPDHLGLVDVFRDLYPDAPDASWVWRGGGTPTRRRFDHVFASPDLRPWSFRYRHDWREADATGERRSDHSGVVVTFQSSRE